MLPTPSNVATSVYIVKAEILSMGKKLRPQRVMLLQLPLVTSPVVPGGQSNTDGNIKI